MGTPNRRSLVDSSQPTLRGLTDALIESEQPEVIEREVVYEADPNALVPQEDGGYVYKRFTMTPRGLEVPPDVTDAELREVGQIIGRLESAMQWVIGDLYNTSEALWGERAAAIAESWGIEPKTAREYGYVCRKLSIRMDKPLRFGHHQVVAALEPEQQRAWLEYALVEGLSVAKLRAALKGDNSPTLPRLMPDVQSDYNFLRSVEARGHSEAEKRDIVARGERIKAAVDAVIEKVLRG